MMNSTVGNKFRCYTIYSTQAQYSSFTRVHEDRCHFFYKERTMQQSLNSKSDELALNFSTHLICDCNYNLMATMSLHR